MKKRFAVIVLVIVLLTTSVFAFAGCQKKDYVIGIMENSEHFSSDMVQKGFRETIRTLMKEAGKSYSIKYKKSGGETSEDIAKSEESNVDYMIKKGADVILALSKSSADSALANAGEIPTVFAQAAIADRDLQESDLSIQVKKQVDLMRLIAPDSTKLGILYCDTGKGKVDVRTDEAENKSKALKTKAEINAELQVKIAKEYIEELELEAVVVGYDKKEDMTHDGHFRLGLNAMKEEGVGCVFVPVDNTLASFAIAPKLHERGNTNIYTKKNKIEARKVANMPIVCGDINMNEYCGVATYAYDYYEMGAQAAREVFDVLVNAKKVGATITTDFSKGKYVINEKVASDISFEIPSSVRSLAA